MKSILPGVFRYTYGIAGAARVSVGFYSVVITDNGGKRRAVEKIIVYL